MIEKEYRQLSCKDFRSDCDFTIRAETDEEILSQCQDHACSAHGKCSDSLETRKRIKSRIKVVWA